jgi:hypothetical protein
MGAHNDWLVGNYTAAKAALVTELHTNMTTTLANVAGIIDKLNQLATVGMPAKSLNAFIQSYPLQACDSGASSTATATAAARQFLPGARALLKGDGMLPLPEGATPVPPPPRGAAAIKAMPATDSVATTTPVIAAAQGSGTTGDAAVGSSGPSAGGIAAGRFDVATRGSGAATMGEGTMSGGATSGSILRHRFNLPVGGAASGSATSMDTTGTTIGTTGAMGSGGSTAGNAAQPMDTPPAAGDATATGGATATGTGASMGAAPLVHPILGGPLMATAAKVNATMGTGNRKLLM